jgi:glycosyltransferase involved in cell wall biosynthesis
MLGHMLAICAGIANEGGHVEVACPAEAGTAAKVRAAGYITHEIEIVGPLNPVADLRAASRLSALIRSADYDVVHAHGFKAGLITRLGAPMGGRPRVIVTVHNHVMFRTDMSSARKAIYRLAERFLEPVTCKLIAVSDALRSELVDAYGLPAGKVVTIPNGIDPTPFLTAYDKDSARAAFDLPVGVSLVGTACRFAAQKGVHDLIDVFAHIRAQRPDIRFVLGGSGPLAEELRVHAEKVGLSDTLIWPGEITDMPQFLAALDVYLNTSLSEGQPIGVLEAMAAGLPVVATAVGGTPEVIPSAEFGLTVPVSDHAAVAQATIELLGDGDRRARMGAAARARVLELFTQERMVESTLAVYRQAIAAGSTRDCTSEPASF